MDVLNGEQIEQIAEVTEDIIEKVGFTVENKEVLKISKKEGAFVDEIKGIVRFPRKLLRELLSRCPSGYRISDLNGNEYIIGGEDKYCLAIVTDPWIIDYKTQLPRRPSLEDIRINTIVGQSIPDVVTMSRMDFPVIDFSDETSSWRALLEHLLHQSKHITFMPGSLEQYREFKKMLEIMREEISRDKNIVSVAVAVVSPLKLGDWNGEVLMDACRNNFPVFPTICPMAGMTSPYTRIGTFIQANVENIFLAALSQLLRPGIPYRYTGGSSVMDLRTGQDRYYTLEKVFEKLFIGQLARRYRLPAGVECGGTMNYCFDGQSGSEGILFMLSACKSGAHLLQGIGSCYNAMGMSAEMMLIHTAWLEVARYLSRGISFEYFQESIESIKNTGAEGNFLTDELTIKNLRSNEFFYSEFFNSGEGKPMLERAHGKVEELVSNFKSPLKDTIKEKLVRYFNDNIFRGQDVKSYR